MHQREQNSAGSNHVRSPSGARRWLSALTQGLQSPFSPLVVQPLAQRLPTGPPGRDALSPGHTKTPTQTPRRAETTGGYTQRCFSRGINRNAAEVQHTAANTLGVTGKHTRPLVVSLLNTVRSSLCSVWTVMFLQVNTDWILHENWMKVRRLKVVLITEAMFFKKG